MIRRVVFMGTPDFAVGTLKALINSEYDVVGVFTQPEKPKGRGGKMQMTPVEETAVAAGIPVFQPKRIREPENLETLKKLNPDVIVVAAFGQIIPKSILELPPFGCVNVHASLLPRWRGAAPIQWSVISGDKESGVTTMRMSEGLDTGDMIEKTVVPLAADETGGSLFDKLARTGADLTLHTLKKLSDGTATFTKQPEESPTPYAFMLKKDMGRIDWTRKACEIDRLVRGLNPWPSAYTKFGAKTLKIWKCRVIHGVTKAGEDIPVPEGIAPGMITEVTKDSFKVQTGCGQLEILELQLEGKKRMCSDAFLRGNRAEKGMQLGD